MYGFEDTVDITFEHILQKVSQESIFELVFKAPIHVGVYYTSPLRTDKKPGARFDYLEDTLFFIDFGDKKRTHRTCFQMVSDFFRLTHTDTIKFIATKFNLSTNLGDYVMYNEEEGEILTNPIKIKEYFNIGFTPKPYRRVDTKYWSQFLINLSQIEEDGVHSVQSYSLNKKIITPYGLCYAITIPGAKGVKLYQPQREKGDFKWITNFTNNDIGNLDKIAPTGKKLIVASSYKDHRVIRNIGIPNTVWFQNEGQIPCDRLNLELIERYDHIYFFYDNDESGREAVLKLAQTYNNYKRDCATGLFLPERCPWKDPAQFISKEGRQDLVNLFKDLGLYENP
jgi:hypothetical protein